MRAPHVAVILSTLVLLGGCARGSERLELGDPSRSPSTGAGRSATQTSSKRTPTPLAPARVVDLAPLPDEGVAIGLDEKHVVLLVAIDGRVLDRLRRFELEYGNGSVPGAVVLTHGGSTYTLDAARGRLVRSGLQPDDLVDQGDGDVALPPPIGSTVEGTRAGSWRWAERSPDGSQWLAQWSGECDSPSVFLAHDGERPVSISGPMGLAHAVEAFALGWSFDGRAIVQLLEPACGRAFPRAGVYAFTAPGEGELVFATRGQAFARMWGAA